MNQKILKAVQQTETGLNTQFVNTNSGRTISREQAITQIQNGNPIYGGYHIVERSNGVKFIRSNPDSKECNNLE